MNERTPPDSNTPITPDTIARTAIYPRNHLAKLSQSEVNTLIDQTDQGLYPLIRKCVLAVLNSGVTSDDGAAMFARFSSFSIEFERDPRGLKLILNHAPAHAFVDGILIETIHDHVFAVLRDLVYVSRLQSPHAPNADSPTDLIFQILRHAQVFDRGNELSCVVCWGGHAVSKTEYEYSQAVGRELGLRRFDICTGCGPGAMKGPMRGALLAHRRQHHNSGRFLGITEPGIIAAEPPNGVVNDIVIMPDIEKRLEAFVRVAHAIVIFPGGAGTFEELLYLLGILLHPNNADSALPVILTGPASASSVIEAYLTFIEQTLGHQACQLVSVILDDPSAVAQAVQTARDRVRMQRIEQHDAYDFNWTLHIPADLQQPFEPTHARMAALNLSKDQSIGALAIQLRCLFSGIVAGNVKPTVQAAVQTDGPFLISGDPTLIAALDRLLTHLIDEQRMKIQGDYEPCYRLTLAS